MPIFTQANFLEAPRLDNIKLLYTPRYRNLKRLWHLAKQTGMNSSGHYRQPLWFIKQQLPFNNFRHWVRLRLKLMWDVFRNHRRDEDEEARYRSLKRLAIQAHDHDNEMKFFAGEVRARRYIRDFPWPWQNGLSSSFRYWTGALYDLTSDFGRSLWRPMALWAFVFCLFSSLYQVNATELVGETCKNSNDMTPRYAANTIAAKNSLLFLGMDRTDKLKRAYGCLYSWTPLIRLSSGAETKQMAPNVPWKVSLYGILHSILSLTLIFLLLLAIRNQFKIK